MMLNVMTAEATWAQVNDTREVLNRLHRLENEVQTLSRQVYRGESRTSGRMASSPSSVAAEPLGSGVAANLEVRLTQLESQIRTLTGQLEEQQHQVSRVQEDLSRALSDIEARLVLLETGSKPAMKTIQGSATPAASSRTISGVTTETLNNDGAYAYDSVQTLGTIRKPVDGGDAPSVSQMQQEGGNFDPAGGAQGLYDQAFARLRQADYPQAEKGFRTFLTQYPDHSLASNAQYWLAETYYVRNEYEQAARLFAEGYQKYPKATKAPDNLLKLGLSLAALGKTEDACLTYQQFAKQFPNDTSPVGNRAVQESKRLGCP